MNHYFNNKILIITIILHYLLIFNRSLIKFLPVNKSIIVPYPNIE